MKNEPIEKLKSWRDVYKVHPAARTASPLHWIGLKMLLLFNAA